LVAFLFLLQKYQIRKIDIIPTIVARTAMAMVALGERLVFDELPVVLVLRDLAGLARSNHVLLHN
jgi:hypothetical protein